MSFTSELFTIDGIQASSIGVNGAILVRTNSEISRSVIGSKNILKDTIRYRNIPYFYGVEKDVITFDLKISLLDNEFDQNAMDELGRIFAKDRYVKFTSCDFPNIEFYVICKSMDLITYGTYKGWISVQLENFASFGVSHCEDYWDFSNLTTTQTFEIYAKFNVMHPKYKEYYYFPILNIDMKGSSTNITITNLSDENRTFGFTGLTAQETLEIDNDAKSIISSTGNGRIDNLVGHRWFRFVSNVNKLTINQPCILQFISYFPNYV